MSSRTEVAPQQVSKEENKERKGASYPEEHNKIRAKNGEQRRVKE